MRGIPTMHNGIKYRSLLEAKWASFFTRSGWQFEYEPFEGNGYIPDFVIYGETPFAIEVKPAVSWKELQSHQEKTRAGLQDIWDHDILIVGASPVEFRSLAGESAIGLLGETNDFAAGLWSSCPQCGRWAITHDYQSYHRRPCSHYDGSQWTISESEREILARHWKRACNEVQWRGEATQARPTARSQREALQAAGLTSEQLQAAKQLFT